MQNFGTAVNATATAMDSAGSAAQENARYMESVEAKVTALKATWQDFANNVLSSDLVKGFLDAANAALEFANNGVGAVLTRMTLFSGVALGLVGILGQIGTKFVGILNTVSGVMNIAGGGQLALITAAITAIVVAILEVKNAIDTIQYVNSFEGLQDKLQETQTEIQSTEQELENYKKRLEELDKVDIGERDSAWETEHTQIENNIKAAERYLEVLDKIARRTAEKLYQSGEMPIGYQAKQRSSESPIQSGVMNAEGEWVYSKEQLEALEAQYDDVYDAASALADVFGFDWMKLEGVEDTNEQLRIMKNYLKGIGIDIEPVTQSTEEAFTAMGDLVRQSSDLTATQKEQAQAYLQNYEAVVKYNVASTQEQQNYVNLAAKMNSYTAGMHETAENVAWLANTFDMTAEEAQVLAQRIGWMQSGTEIASDQFVKMADGTLAWVEAVYLGEDGLYHYKEGFDELSGSIDGATQSMQEWFAASGQSEHGEQLQEDLDAYAAAMDALAAGEYGSTAIETAVTSLLSTEKLSEFGYDAGRAMEYLANSTDSVAGRIYNAADPLSQFYDELAGLGDEYVQVDDNGIRLIASIEDIAKAMGLSDEAVKSLIDGLQLYSPTLLDSEASMEDTKQKFAELSEQISETDEPLTVTNGNIQNLIDSIKTTQGVTDPTQISAWVSAMSDAGLIDLSALGGSVEEVYAAIGEAITKSKELDEVEVNPEPELDDETFQEDLKIDQEAIDEFATTYTATLKLDDTAVQSKIAAIKQALATTFTVTGPASNAEGTDYAEGGPTLVNDGTPVNGSAAELIVQDGHAFIANNGEPTMVNLERGAKVYTAQETYDITHGKTSGYYQAFAGGTLITRPTNSKFTGYSATKSSSTTSSISNTYTGSTSSSSDSSSKSELEEWYDEWLKAKKHALAMDEITEEQYYRDLEEINEKYLKDASDMRDEYWSNQEDIYKWNKEQIEDQLEAEEKLQETMNNIAKAASARLLVYQGGAFRYVNDLEALSEATKDASSDVLSALGYTDGISYSQLGTYGGVSGINVPSYGSTYGDTFNIGSVELADVQDVNGLFNGLKNLALQTAKTR